MTVLKPILFLYLLLFATMLFSQEFTGVKKIRQCTRDYSEFGPAYFGDGIVYCSNIRQNIIVSKQSAENTSYYNIYYANPDNSTIPDEFPALDSMINSPFNDGPVSSNGEILFFGRNHFIKKGGKKQRYNVGLYYCAKKGDNWQSPVSFPYNNQEYNLGHPALSSDGTTLYFASDMPGGLGDYDIYYSVFSGGEWSKPVNLGNKVNTPGSDLYPFIHSSGRFYFSTNYYDTLKRFDIYYTDFIDSAYSEPARLKEPVNSEFNDFAFICDITTENGFFTSDRDGTDDIFRFFSTLPVFEKCDTMIERNYCYHFEEAKSVDLDTIPGVYEWVFEDTVKIKSEFADYCFPGPGFYDIVLNMIDTLTDEYVQTIASYSILIEDPVQPYIFCPETITTDLQVEFDATQSNMPEAKIEQYVWIFSDNVKLLGNKITRTFNEPGTYSVQLGVIFNRDEKGQVQKACIFKEFLVGGK